MEMEVPVSHLQTLALNWEYPASSEDVLVDVDFAYLLALL